MMIIMELEMDMTEDVKKKVDKILPNVVESIGDFIDDQLDEHVFNNKEFKDITWEDKIKVVNYMLYKIKELV